MEAPCRFNVFVGSETGFIKGVNTFKNEFSNLNAVTKAGSGIDRNEEITCMCWEDNNEETIYAGLRNQTVKVFSVRKGTIVSSIDATGGTGPLRGIGLFNRSLLTCTESGFVKLWSKKKKEKEEAYCKYDSFGIVYLLVSSSSFFLWSPQSPGLGLVPLSRDKIAETCIFDFASNNVVVEAGPDIWRMRQNQQCPNKFATGGKENDLKIWDLQTPQLPVFTAKNVRNDFLDLRVPVWICDIQFVPDSDRVITSTGYNQVRVYDPKAGQRRPVINMEVDEYPLLSLSLAAQENQLVVGNSHGRVALLDLRKRALVHVFKGFAGSVRHVQCHPSLPLLASCGLDRHLHIHNLHDRKLSNKLYLKSRLNCLLVRSDFSACSPDDSSEVPENVQKMLETKEGDSLWENIGIASGSEDEEASPRQMGQKTKVQRNKGKPGKKRKNAHHQAET